ncbi:hypothetical protein BC938DRAFT_476495 [Jimgerdemannia flammicorona]|uniref:Methyltransferase type 11 domain-containing protein n=1 Tax=Jimgerdemannia flammicorona TaxID=994334 RepID=A0A433QQJ4_9FUNG|nr:hypothetical protein BC938DRAFT_476495 [Jimgerdemannia flammicorona]
MVGSTSRDVIPDDPTAYKTKEYWEERYAKCVFDEAVYRRLSPNTHVLDPAREPPEISFDWFKKYADLKPLLNEHIPDKNASVLMLGCGNSTLSEDMYDDGYKHITNIDFSTVVIENMRTRCADRSEMKCEYRKTRYVLMIPSNTPGDLCLRIHLRFCPKGLEMDIRALKFDDLSFDIILDKGTMDALMCDRGDVWSPDEELIRAVKGEVDEVVR